MNNTTQLKTRAKRRYRSIMEMDLIDNFLFNQVVRSQKFGEEFCRLLLCIILGRPIRSVRVQSQMELGGEDVDLRGARLDVYVEESADGETFNAYADTYFDIEPEKKLREKDALPQRSRFYHAKMAQRFLKPGDKMEMLPKAFVIFITSFDPFGKGRLIYTFRNTCLEDPDVPYDDGAVTIFLNCTGHAAKEKSLSALIDDSRPSLEALARYFVDSASEPIDSPEVELINNIVTQVKHEKEVSIMNFRYEEDLEDAREEGKALGGVEKLLNQVIRKVRLGQSVDKIADDLVEDIDVIRPIYESVLDTAPDYDINEIYERIERIKIPV